MKTSLFLTTAMAALLITGAASAAKKTYVSSDISSDNVVGGTDPNSAFTATAIITVDDTANTICGKVTFAPATGFAGTNARIHEGDAETENGEVIVEVTDEAYTDSLDIALEDVEATAIAKFAAGDSYLTLGTTDFADGALRGQLALDETAEEQACPTTGTPDAGTGTGNDAGASSSSSSSSSGSTATPTDTTDDGGCNTSGGSSGNALAILAGLGIVVAAASRKKNKKA